jgi:hypothetical protein
MWGGGVIAHRYLPPHIGDPDDDNRSPYWRCSHCTTMILVHQKIFERTDDLACWLVNLTAERNHLKFRDRRSRSHDRRSNSRSSSRKSPSRRDTANNFWSRTTNATEIEHNVVPSPAPSTRRETRTADVSGVTRLPKASGRLFITDQPSKSRFLNDTGSHLCVFPRKHIPQCRSCIHYDLCAANGTTIPTYGWLPLSLNLGLHYITLQDTDVELPTLMASNIALWLEKQIPDTTVSSYCDTSAGQPRPYVSAFLLLQVFQSASPPPATRTTHSCRHVHFPARFSP